MVLATNFCNKKIYMGCDKGKKKGIGHFIKVLSNLNDDGFVYTQLLDIDVARGTSKDAALAIKASMNKLKANDNDDMHLLCGTRTDSGGGGTLKSPHKELRLLGLCAPINVHLVANCCIHSLQVQLSNAVKETFGEGKIDGANAMQLLCSVWHLQESIDLNEQRHILYKSNKWVLKCMPEEQPEVKSNKRTKRTTAQENEATFVCNFTIVCGFHSKFKKVLTSPTNIAKRSLLGKMQAPISTQWWTVGSTSSYAFDYYLVLFHAWQTIINMCSSNTTPNIIASALFSMMKNQETFIDMTLIRCFHKVHINPNFDWLQPCTDLSGVKGFCSHHIAICFHLMQKDIQHLLLQTHFPGYTKAVNNWKDGNVDPTECAHHGSLHQDCQRVSIQALPTLVESFLVASRTIE